MLLAPSPLRGEGWGEGWVLAVTPIPLTVIPAKAGSASQQPKAGHPVTLLWCEDSATWLACGGLPTSCRRPGHFSLFGQRKVTKREATPMARLPGLQPGRYAGGLRGFSTGHPCPDEKLAGLPAGHPAGYSSTRPPRHRGPEVKSESQSQSGAHRAPEAAAVVSPCPWVPCRSALVRDRSVMSLPLRRLVAHQCAPTEKPPDELQCDVPRQRHEPLRF